MPSSEEVPRNDPSRIWAWLARSTLPRWVKLALINIAAHIGAFWTTNALLALVYKYRWFAKYKLQETHRFPRPGLVRKALLSNLMNDLVAFPAVSWVFERILTYDSGKKSNPDGIDANDEDGGWSGLRFQGAVPHWSTTAWQTMVAYLGYDFMFYLSHRMLHQSQFLYKNVHSKHHQFVTTIGISSSHQHWFEGAIQMLAWFLPIGFAGWLNRKGGGLHAKTLFWYNVFRWLETVDAHCGYAFPFSPFNAIPLFGGARLHDLHHESWFGNYGASVIWDRLLGTENPLYKKWRLGKS